MRHSSAVYFVHIQNLRPVVLGKYLAHRTQLQYSSKPKEKQTGCISSIIIVVRTIHLMKLKVPPVYSFSFGFHESQFTAYSAFVSPTTVLHGLYKLHRHKAKFLEFHKFNIKQRYLATRLSL